MHVKLGFVQRYDAQRHDIMIHDLLPSTAPLHCFGVTGGTYVFAIDVPTIQLPQ